MLKQGTLIDATLVEAAARRLRALMRKKNSMQVAASMAVMISAAVLFSGCPPAVQPYLLGDIPALGHRSGRDGQGGCRADGPGRRAGD